MAQQLTDDERFWAYVEEQETPTGVRTVWTGRTVKAGSHPEDRYGVFTVGGRDVMAHVYAYTRANGPIPRGYRLARKNATASKLSVDPEDWYLKPYRGAKGRVAADHGRVLRFTKEA